jgi:ketosteroid isomerase-like protein
MKSDYELIRELTARYAGAIDAKDYTAIAACFTDDACVIYAGYSDELQGIEEILGHMRRALEPIDVTQHLFANFIIDIEGDDAAMTCDILAQHLHHGETFLAGGKYEVGLAREDGNWKFARISARTVWSVGNRDLLPKAG